MIAEAKKAAEDLQMELDGPCCPGPAYHDAGTDAIDALIALVQQLRTERDALREQVEHVIRCASYEDNDKLRAERDALQQDVERLTHAESQKP